MRRHLTSAVAAVFSALLLAGCVSPVGPIEVTRFHLPDTSMLGRGPIAVEAAPGQDAGSLEMRSYQAAVLRQLQRLGYSQGVAGPGHVALVRFERRTFRPDRRRGPVSVGVGGSTGSYGSGVGLGLGIDLSGPPPELTETELGVMIRDRSSGATLWEGRARFAVRANSPLAQTQLGAEKMAQALFRGFPGRSGETIEVAP